jgi:hypothetical protein
LLGAAARHELQELTGPEPALHAPLTVSASASILQLASFMPVCAGPQVYLIWQNGMPGSWVGLPADQTPSIGMPLQSAAAGKLPNSSKKQAINTCRAIGGSCLFVARALMAGQTVTSPFCRGRYGEIQETVTASTISPNVHAS